MVRASHPELGTICGTAMALREFCSLRTKPTMSGCFAVPTEAPTRKTPSIQGAAGAINPAGEGTKAAAHYTVTVAPASRLPCACA
jgi:hypothetical protein